MNKVDDEMAGVAGGERVLVNARALGGGEFRLDVVVAQGDGVIPRLGDLVLMREPGAVPGVGILPRSWIEMRWTDSRHDKNIQQVPDTRAAQVGVAETHDGIVGIVIAGAPVPTGVKGVGTELDHAKRDGGRKVGVSVSAGSYIFIHVLRRIIGGRHQRDRAGNAGS